MPHYLQQVAYSTDGWEAVLEKLGGKIESAWFAFGEYDVVLIIEMPTNVDAGAIAMAFAAGGACKAVKTTPLLSVAEGVEAMKKASAAGYRSATATG
jgi:uncharacterized protein with GYD domain